MDSRSYFVLSPNSKNDDANQQRTWGVGGEAGPPYFSFKKAAGNTNEQQRETIEVIEHVIVLWLFIQKRSGALIPGSPYIYRVMDQFLRHSSLNNVYFEGSAIILIKHRYLCGGIPNRSLEHVDSQTVGSQIVDSQLADSQPVDSQVCDPESVARDCRVHSQSVDLQSVYPQTVDSQVSVLQIHKSIARKCRLPNSRFPGWRVLGSKIGRSRL